MYSYEHRMRTVLLNSKLGKRTMATLRRHGYPNNIRTARSRTSDEYVGAFFFGVSIAPYSLELKPPTNPARYTSW